VSTPKNRFIGKHAQKGLDFNISSLHLDFREMLRGIITQFFAFEVESRENARCNSKAMLNIGKIILYFLIQSLGE
jgi:hypothetical protein